MRSSARPTPAPTSCAMTNGAMCAGLMPAKVVVNPRASVTAGFANEVDAVNQYAAAMYAPTAAGADQARALSQESTTKTRPAVATISLSHWPELERSFADHC